MRGVVAIVATASVLATTTTAETVAGINVEEVWKCFKVIHTGLCDKLNFSAYFWRQKEKSSKKNVANGLTIKMCNYLRKLSPV